MMTLKISCMQCQKHSECSHRTQFFVNYCGAEQKKIAQAITTAISECRARRSRLFKTTLGFHALAVPRVAVPT
jgi:hypothetical protein